MTPRLTVGARVFCRAGYGVATEFVPVGIAGWMVRVELDRGGYTLEPEGRVERVVERPALRLVTSEGVA